MYTINHKRDAAASKPKRRTTTEEDDEDAVDDTEALPPQVQQQVFQLCIRRSPWEPLVTEQGCTCSSLPSKLRSASILMMFAGDWLRRRRLWSCCAGATTLQMTAWSCAC